MPLLVPQPIDSSQSPDSVTFNFLNIGQELTEIGDVDDWWEGGHGGGGGFLGKITMVDGVLAYFWYPIEFGQKDKKGHVPEILLCQKYYYDQHTTN